MKISYKWISNYVDIPDMPDNLQAFCDKLDLTGTGVEGIEKLGNNFDKIVVGQIASKEPHPDSDHMWLCKVNVGSANVDDAGNPENLQIVCGAQNFEQGDKVCVALIGAVLPGNFKIKKSKLRGVYSCGMNCSERELGLSDEHEGIMILDKDAPLGQPIADYLHLSDIIFDTEITPNRPDCLSVVGCAREIAAIYNTEYKNPAMEMAQKLEACAYADLSKGPCGTVNQMPTVTIDDPERCNRYTARVISGVKIGPSPKWMVKRLSAMGCRSVNNVVDASNYILYLFGQPLHTFDYDKLIQKDRNVDITVRAAKDGEKFTTLDHIDRTLNNDMTVIATNDRPVALAGVMGGLNSEVDENTTTILLETATFSPAHTSRTSRNLDLISESSMRYERRVDDVDIRQMSDAAAALIVEVAGGTICGENEKLHDSLICRWPVRTSSKTLNFRTDRFRKMMGAEIPNDFIETTLSNLGCDVTPTGDDFEVVPPTFRPDLEREIDLYEEVLRIYGMDKIESSLPRSSYRVGERTLRQKQIDTINNTMISCGLTETSSYSFADKNDLELFNKQNEIMGFGNSVVLLNPMNKEQQTMRQSIIPGLLRSVVYNLNHSVDSISLYETGITFKAKNGQQKPTETMRLAGVLCGIPSNASWNNQANSYDFFDAKGCVEQLLNALNCKKIRYKAINPESAPHLQPGRAASITVGGSIIGWIGEIHPKLCAAFEIDQSIAAFEINIDLLLKVANEFPDYKEIPVYPSISIDVAFVVDSNVSHEMMAQRINSAGGKYLASAKLFDVYINEKQLGKDKKSMAYKLEYRDPNKTLRRQEVDGMHEKLIKKVCASTGAEVRS